jgi:hypothetical protein
MSSLSHINFSFIIIYLFILVVSYSTYYNKSPSNKFTVWDPIHVAPMGYDPPTTIRRCNALCVMCLGTDANVSG